MFTYFFTPTPHQKAGRERGHTWHTKHREHERGKTLQINTERSGGHRNPYEDKCGKGKRIYCDLHLSNSHRVNNMSSSDFTGLFLTTWPASESLRQPVKNKPRSIRLPRCTYEWASFWTREQHPSYKCTQISTVKLQSKPGCGGFVAGFRILK